MSAILLLLLLSMISTTAAQSGNPNIGLGSSLTPTGRSAWFSPSRLFAFGFYQQGDGYAVGIFLAGDPQRTVVWTANRDDSPVPSTATLLLTTDGRFIIQSPQGREIYITDDSSQKVAKASMLDSGNFVLYNSAHDIIWQSFDHPTTTIVQGQRLLAGMELFSSVSETDQSTGIFRLKIQTDGNLVQYPVDTPDIRSYSYWASDTYGSGYNVSLNLENDGHLYLVNSTGSNIKDLIKEGYHTNGTIYLIKIDSDGIFRLYSYRLNQNWNQSILWSSTNDKCAPKGLCGLNGYCVNEDKEPDCRCLPGFAPVMDGNFTAGCERNFSSESCKSDHETIHYTIQAVENTEWENMTYSTLSLTTREACETSCLEDCNCEAAMFTDGQCMKQKLPLRFGRRNLANSNVALIKVGIPTSSSSESRKPDVSKNGKEKHHMTILIIGLSLIAFAIIVLAVSAALIHRSHVFSYKR